MKQIKNRKIVANTLISMEEKEDFEVLPEVPSKQKWKSEDVNTHIANIKQNNSDIMLLNSNVDYIKELLTKVEDISSWKKGVNKHTHNNETEELDFLNTNFLKTTQIKSTINFTFIAGAQSFPHVLPTKTFTKNVGVNDSEDEFRSVASWNSKGTQNDGAGRPNGDMKTLLKSNNKCSQSVVKNNNESNIMWAKGGTCEIEYEHKLIDPLHSVELLGSVGSMLLNIGLEKGTITEKGNRAMIRAIKSSETIGCYISDNNKSIHFTLHYNTSGKGGYWKINFTRDKDLILELRINIDYLDLYKEVEKMETMSEFLERISRGDIPFNSVKIGKGESIMKNYLSFNLDNITGSPKQ